MKFSEFWNERMSELKGSKEKWEFAFRLFEFLQSIDKKPEIMTSGEVEICLTEEEWGGLKKYLEENKT